MSEEMKTVEVPEPVTTEEVQRPSVDEAKEAGWSAAEIESAKKRNMLVEEVTPEDKAKKEAEEKVKAEAEAKANEPTVKPEVKAPSNFLADMDKELTPEQEKVFLEVFPPGTKPRAFYFRAKNERHARQAAEARIRELEARIDEASKNKAEKKVVLDEEGNEIDPRKQPLTLEMLENRERERQEAFDKRQAELRIQQERLSEVQKTQEEYARTLYPDFDEKIKTATEVVSGIKSGTLIVDEVIPEKWKQKKVGELLEELHLRNQNADKYGIEDYNAAFVAYEIGQLIADSYKPNGKQAEKPQDGQQSHPKASGGLTPEQMKRVEQNNQRRSSSASIPSGNGSRTVIPEEVTRDDINRMNYEKRSEFKRKYPDQYRKAVYETA